MWYNTGMGWLVGFLIVVAVVVVLGGLAGMLYAVLGGGRVKAGAVADQRTQVREEYARRNPGWDGVQVPREAYLAIVEELRLH